MTAFIPTVENMPGSRAQRPGDVQKTLSGKTVEVINTEEEKNGRIVADFLLEKDQIFVPTVLKGGDPGNEQTLFWEMKQKVMPEYPVPDLVVYLQIALLTEVIRLHTQSTAPTLGSKKQLLLLVPQQEHGKQITILD